MGILRGKRRRERPVAGHLVHEIGGNRAVAAHPKGVADFVQGHALYLVLVQETEGVRDVHAHFWHAVAHPQALTRWVKAERPAGAAERRGPEDRHIRLRSRSHFPEEPDA